MKKISILFVLLCAMVFNACHETKYPQAEITNGILKAHLYLPDTENGYYRGSRFDWSGVISSLEYKEHTYFGKWFEENNPYHVAIMGPVEAYAPLNYSEVEPGNDFVKIGIGVMTKPSDEAYSKFKLYTLVDSGTWKITQKANEIQFVHLLNNENYSYEYTKSVQLVMDEPKMIISHSIKNTGKRSIETDGFNHNFFVIDNQPIGKGFELTFADTVSGTGKGMGEVFELQGKKITFKRDLKLDETIDCKYLKGINNSVKNFDIKIDNNNTGAGVRITGDHPLSRVRLWGTAKTLCPETYLDIKVEPGKEFKWSYYYEFYESNSISQ